jgi:hypothetical protein
MTQVVVSPSKLDFPIVPVQSALPVEPAKPSLEQWLDTIGAATTAVIGDMPRRTRDQAKALALLQAIDGATVALDADKDTSAALQHGLRAALQTARATSIAAQAFDNPEDKIATEAKRLGEEIAKSTRQSRLMWAETGKTFLSGVMDSLAPRLGKIDPELEALARKGATIERGWHATAVKEMRGTLEAIRRALLTYESTGTSMSLVPYTPAGRFDWLWRR